MKCPTWLLLSILVPMQSSLAQSSGTDATDGRIVAETPCAPMLPYDSLRTLLAQVPQRIPSRGDYERLVERIECTRLSYLSDGLKVTGYLYKPRETTGRKLPVLIVNRGGNRELSQLPPRLPAWAYPIAQEDFVILAPQYRGTDGGEGQEEFGGADLNDVLSLFPLAASLPYADMRNVFMLGYSRGGMMTYLALKSGAPVRAAAVWAGPTDLAELGVWRPEMREHVFRELMPDFEAREAEHYRHRSAVEWPEAIRAPVLILHGAADNRVKASDALRLASLLQALGRTYQLIVYAEDDHGLSRNSRDANERILEWFRSHLQR